MVHINENDSSNNESSNSILVESTSYIYSDIGSVYNYCGFFLTFFSLKIGILFNFFHNIISKIIFSFLVYRKCISKIIFILCSITLTKILMEHNYFAISMNFLAKKQSAKVKSALRNLIDFFLLHLRDLYRPIWTFWTSSI